MRVGGQLHAPAALLPEKRPGTHCIGGWVGPRGNNNNNNNYYYYYIFARDEGICESGIIGLLIPKLDSG
jgi:hypothetical protein